MKNDRLFAGLLFIVLASTITVTSAYVYQSATQTVTQTIKEVASLTLQNSALGSINEGETRTVTKATVASLGSAVSVTAASTLNLHFSSDLASQASSYSTYDIVVKLASKPAGSSLIVDNTYATMSIGTPNPAGFALDAAGTYVFDFEVTCTAKSVSSDTPTTVTITVSAESS